MRAICPSKTQLLQSKPKSSRGPQDPQRSALMIPPTSLTGCGLLATPWASHYWPLSTHIKRHVPRASIMAYQSAQDPPGSSPDPNLCSYVSSSFAMLEIKPRALPCTGSSVDLPSQTSPICSLPCTHDSSHSLPRLCYFPSHLTL